MKVHLDLCREVNAVDVVVADILVERGVLKNGERVDATRLLALRAEADIEDVIYAELALSRAEDAASVRFLVRVGKLYLCRSCREGVEVDPRVGPSCLEQVGPAPVCPKSCDGCEWIEEGSSYVRTDAPHALQAIGEWFVSRGERP